MRRTLLSWTLVFALLVAGFAATIAALNNDLYSAHGFVRNYLETLARQDSAAALAIDGVAVPADAGRALVTDGALGEISDIRLLSDSESDGIHTVRFGYDLGEGMEFTDFTVETTGTRFWFFPTWRFAESPIATLDVAVLNDSRFTANGVSSSTASGPLAVFTPGRFELDHDSTYLAATPVAISVVTPGETGTATLEALPTEAFHAAASTAIAEFLDDCAAQSILFPTGCPFGQAVSDRLTGLPSWSITSYPTVTVNASGIVGVWQTTVETGTAHLTASVTSLLDGSVSTLTEDVSFRSDYVVTLAANDTLSVTLPAP